MSNYRNRPKGNYIQEASWQELYMLTESWKNDLEFNFIDVKFLELLLDAYLVKLLINQNLTEIRELQREVYELIKQCINLQELIKIHFTHIIDLIDEPLKYDESVFRVEHELFEDEIVKFKTKLEAIRYIVFNAANDALESEKPMCIWKYN